MKIILKFINVKNKTYTHKKVLPLKYIITSLIFIFIPVLIIKAQKVVRYDLYISDTMVNFTGKVRHAIAVNGQIPMPTLTFTEGDTAEIYAHNELNEGTALHWHGVFLPNEEDGVPFLTQMPIPPHSTHIYRFPIKQSGTHWYHSHWGMQEQIGMYGLLVLNKKQSDTTFRPNIDDIPVVPVVISDWTDYHAHNVERMLHNANDWFAIKKGSTQSYWEAIKTKHFKTKIVNEWKRMLAMDVSDVYYDKFLINGKQEQQLTQFKAGDKVRLRIANAGASTYFWLTYGGGKITVVGNDGNDVEPVDVDRLLIAVSETYDVVVTIPDVDSAFQFLATSEDRIGNASLYLGGGIKQVSKPLPRLDYFAGMRMMNNMMKFNGDMDDMGMEMTLNQMDMNRVMYPEIKNHKIKTLNYAMLRSPANTILPQDTIPPLELHFALTGNMNRYVWSLNNKTLSEADFIKVKKGQNLKMILYNGTMMRHPIHLHGHDFRLLNGQGTNAPLKNVVDLMPMEVDTIEFNANVEGDWIFHCHILYHMMSGMGRVFSTTPEAPRPLIPDPNIAKRKLYNDDRRFYLSAENDLATNGNDGEATIQNTRWSLNAEWRIGYNDNSGYESEFHLGRYFGKMQWIMPFIGFDARYRKTDKIEKNLFSQYNTKNLRKQFSVGIAYTLPMLFILQAEVYHDGNVRVQLKREDIPISKRVRMALSINTDKEYTASLKYILNKNCGITVHYDSDMGLGVGANFMY